MSHMEFGQCLHYLLTTLGISINRLAKAINVDSSLANRWVNGKRIPAYNSVYIENIAEVLALNVKNSLQAKRIEKLFLDVHGTTEDSSIEEKIRKILYESQGYSFEIRKKKKAENECQRHKTEKTPHAPSTHQLSTQDKIISGTQNIIAACVDIFNSALDISTSNRKIYITYFNEMPVGKHDLDYVLRFQNSLLILLENGWEIHFLAKINDNNQRTVNLINFIKPLISTRRFFIYYLNSYDQSFVGTDFVIVSNYCAVTCFIINSKNAASLFRTPAAVELYAEYVENLISSYGQPLLTCYSMQDGLEYDFRLANCEDTIGNRILYKDCFGVITFPIHLYRKLLKRKKLSTVEIKKALIFYDKRLEAFKHNIGAYEHIDLYPINSINHLIKHQQIYLYDHTGINPVQLQVEEIIELLENIIHLLQEHENYHIAFLTEKNTSTLNNTMFYCMVKEKVGVFLTIINPQENDSVLRISIDNPMVVFAFEAYFKGLWQQAAPLLKDKTDVIEWLKREIALLRSTSVNARKITSRDVP